MVTNDPVGILLTIFVVLVIAWLIVQVLRRF